MFSYMYTHPAEALVICFLIHTGLEKWRTLRMPRTHEDYPPLSATPCLSLLITSLSPLSQLFRAYGLSPFPSRPPIPPFQRFIPPPKKWRQTPLSVPMMPSMLPRPATPPAGQYLLISPLEIQSAMDLHQQIHEYGHKQCPGQDM